MIEIGEWFFLIAVLSGSILLSLLLNALIQMKMEEHNFTILKVYVDGKFQTFKGGLMKEVGKGLINMPSAQEQTTTQTIVGLFDTFIQMKQMGLSIPDIIKEFTSLAADETIKELTQSSEVIPKKE